MRTFNAYFKKEMIESWRQFRYLILAVGFVFFAILDPLMLKILPVLLESQIPADLMSLMKFTPLDAVTNYMKDIFQFGNIFVVLTLMGIYSDEITGQKLVFPYSKGARTENIVLAKIVHYGLALLMIVMTGFLCNYYYVNILFEGEQIQFTYIVNAALLFSLYCIFTISILFLISSFTKRGLVAGISVLLLNFFQPLLTQFDFIAKWLPHTLIQQANRLTGMNIGIVWQSVLIVGIYIIACQVLTIWRMRKVEVL